MNFSTERLSSVFAHQMADLRTELRLLMEAEAGSRKIFLDIEDLNDFISRNKAIYR
jgi:hypothetical protein